MSRKPDPKRFLLPIFLVILFSSVSFYRMQSFSPHEPPVVIHRRCFYEVRSSVLLPDSEMLLILDNNGTSAAVDIASSFWCSFSDQQDEYTVTATFFGVLSHNRSSFKCAIPESLQKFPAIHTPLLFTESITNDGDGDAELPKKQEAMLMKFLSYDSFTTNQDVVVFAKGINRHSRNLDPSSLRCVFNTNILTSVTSSSGEVFRCLRPSSVLFSGEDAVKISLEIKEQNSTTVLVPSVALYTPPSQGPPLVNQEQQFFLCATTMVFNVAKFLREWVIYHSNIGVEWFLFYDNGSEDNLREVVEQLEKEGYDISVIFWAWPKTQEAGFSHSAAYARDLCRWMMYMDVDEFVFSPAWLNATTPSHSMMKSLIPSNPKIGQVMIWCQDFGPSNQTSHPVMGVTQGYTCRRKDVQRHKSLVLLEAIHPSLFTVIHHFRIKDDYSNVKLSVAEGLVNHYKYQAWSEFKAKFRRRASSNVVDWKEKSNPTSKDRTPGLGFEAVEPKGWPQKYCDVADHRLQNSTLRWFGHETDFGYRMAWQLVS